MGDLDKVGKVSRIARVKLTLEFCVLKCTAVTSCESAGFQNSKVRGHYTLKRRLDEGMRSAANPSERNILH